MPDDSDSDSRTPVLVVDDDASVRKAVCMVLEDAGFACQTAENGAQALTVLRAAATGMVVLLDLMMPVLTGQEVLAAVEADPLLAGRHTFIVLTATYRPMLMREQAVMNRLHALILYKPFDIESLLRAVRYEAMGLSDGAAQAVG